MKNEQYLNRQHVRACAECDAAEASAKDARRKALEEAAKQGEHIIDDWTIRDSDPTGLSRSAVRIFMTRIRALQGPTP